MPVLAEVHVFPVCIVILCSKVIIIFLQFYCGYVFSMVVKVNFRSNTARGKTSQQCEVGNASCIREGSIKLTGHPPYSWTWICPPQRCILRCPLLTICLATFPSTISLHLWPTLHSWAHTNLHPWWIPFDSPQWAEGHVSWVPHWSVSQCRNWATTSTTHRWTSYTQINKQEEWSPSRHFSWQLLGKRPEPCIYWHKGVQPLRAESPKYFPYSVLQERAGNEKSVWSTCQRSGAWSFSTLGGRGPTANMVYKEYPQWLPRNMTHSCAQQLCA